MTGHIPLAGLWVSRQRRQCGAIVAGPFGGEQRYFWWRELSKTRSMTEFLCFKIVKTSGKSAFVPPIQYRFV
jgi:hypothetical protein